MTREGREPATSLGAILSKSRTLSNDRRITWQEWASAVGNRIAARSKPVFYDGDTLTVMVASAAWAQELSFLEVTILERLSQRGRDLRRLRFRVGEVVIGRPRSTRKVEVEQAPLPRELQEKLELVADEDLRRAIATAASFSIGRK